MPISMSSASLPILRTMLRNLDYILDKGQAHAQARKFDPQVLCSARLAPDMLPLSKQIQIACDAAKNGVARLSGVEAPKFEDDEATIEDLKARIARTLAWLRRCRRPGWMARRTRRSPSRSAEKPPAP